jgi:hypothetical protein
VMRVNDLPLPFVSAWDPRATASGSIDPLGALRPFTAIATTVLPGVTTITGRVRYLSWVCAGLRLLDETADAPTGGRAGRARRQRLLAWERLVALATGTYAASAGVGDDDDAWRLLRGVSYVRRAVNEGIRSPAFPMLRNQAGVGGVGTYWVTLVAGGLVEDDAGQLTPRGVQLADAFLGHQATPERSSLLPVLRGAAVTFAEPTLVEWGRVAHLGAATGRERSLLADTLLDPPAHRRVASAMQASGASTSDEGAFRRLSERLRQQRDPLAERLAAVLAVAIPFERLHRTLLYRFDQVRALGHRRPAPLGQIELRADGAALPYLGDALRDALGIHGVRLPRPVTEALHSFALAVEPTVRTDSDMELVRNLIRHHERVQSGKLDASRQPKLPWLELRGNDVIVAPRYALAEPPSPPDDGGFTHPYRIEQFSNMLGEAGAWATES